MPFGMAIILAFCTLFLPVIYLSNLDMPSDVTREAIMNV